MLRIIHTGRAYEVIDDGDRPGLLYTLDYAFDRLREEYAESRCRYWQQTTVLGKACREVWRLKELLENTEQKLRATERKLKSCQ